MPLLAGFFADFRIVIEHTRNGGFADPAEIGNIFNSIIFGHLVSYSSRKMPRINWIERKNKKASTAYNT